MLVHRLSGDIGFAVFYRVEDRLVSRYDGLEPIAIATVFPGVVDAFFFQSPQHRGIDAISRTTRDHEVKRNIQTRKLRAIRF